ncbi:MAG: M56 family metallopeptidase [Candidatus Latescibacterota bacterium]
MENLFYLQSSFIHYLFVSSLQVIPLVVLIGIISAIFGNKSTNFRYWLWSVVIFRLCLPFNVSLPFEPEFNKSIVQGTVNVARNFVHTGQAATDLLPSSSVQLSQSPLINVHSPIINYLLIIWICAVAVLLVFFVFRIHSLKRTLHHYPKVERTDLLDLLEELRDQLHIRRSIDLYYLDTQLSISPLLYGVLRPKIFIPGIIVQNWSVEDIKPILLHELQHIKRFDPVMNWVLAIIGTIYFFHPLVWMVNKKIKNYQEDSCDDLSIQKLGNKKKTYLNCIINVLMETSKEHLFGVPAIAFSERNTSVSRRVIRISDKNYKPTNTLKKKYVAALLFVGLVSVMISCDNLVGYKDQSIQNPSEQFQSSKIVGEVKENIHIMENGDVIISGKIVPEENLVEAIKEVIKQNDKKEALILLDKNARQEDLPKVIQAATLAEAKFIMTINK